MNEYKIGGKITLTDNTAYRIIDIVKEDDIEYLFCCTTQKPIEPKLFEKREQNGKVFVRLEEDQKIMRKVCSILSQKI